METKGIVGIISLDKSSIDDESEDVGIESDASDFRLLILRIFEHLSLRRLSV